MNWRVVKGILLEVGVIAGIGMSSYGVWTVSRSAFWIINGLMVFAFCIYQYGKR